MLVFEKPMLDSSMKTNHNQNGGLYTIQTRIKGACMISALSSNFSVNTLGLDRPKPAKTGPDQDQIRPKLRTGGQE